MRTIAIQGSSASYHDIATRQFFGDDIQTINCDLPFKNVFNTLAKADNAVVAIENSLHGSINEVYDLLLANNVNIIGEVYLKVSLCLIGLEGATIDELEEVHSHPIALSECEDYLDSALAHVQRFEHFDTAGSVADVKKWNNPKIAAIAGEQASKLHNMTSLARNIETHHENYTRFVVLGKSRGKLKKATKASLILKTADKPGALHEALGHFVSRDLNLSKLESRPIIGNAWHYLFYVDVESAAVAEKLPLVTKDLLKSGCEVQLLGTYEKAEITS